MKQKEKKEDRRIQRTRQLLLQALFSLIEEKGFDVVTVQDIIDRANVGRSTFYTHFVDKEDLLVQAMDPFSAQLKERQRKGLQGGPSQGAFAFSHELFSHADGHRGIFRAMIGKQSSLVLQRHFQRIQVELVREEVRAMVPQDAASAVLLEGVVQYLASGLHGLLSWWMDGKRRMPVDEVNDLYRRMAVSVVKVAFG
jgi:AcrR family transcriptional regulator